MPEQLDYNTIFVSLDLLVTSCLRAQEWPGANFFSSCVIRFSPPRGAGLTAAIQKVSKRFSSPIFMTYSMALGRELYPDVEQSRILSYNAGPRMQLAGCIADAIFVDGASYMTKDREQELLHVAAGVSASQSRFCLALLG